ncbi:MAG TPA: DUF998 domain-containing protein [Candidatus Elarobacter sp.]|jgi:hypothetical membrane protein|nr:DUF998 domain-containing protein [Candidatus Elarobacter sp.]
MPARALLAAAIAMPFLYFATLIVAGIANPSIPLGAVPSMLGTAPAPQPAIYNAGMIVTALAGLAGALGIALQLPKIGAGRVLGTLTALAVALSSLGLAEAGLFPLPSPYHEAFGLSLFGAFTPLLGGFALMRARDDRRAVAALFIAFAAIVVLFLILNGLGGIVTNANAGVWVRIIAIPVFGSVAVIGWRARRRAS